MTRWNVLLIVLLFSFAPGVAMGGAALSAYERGDFETALRLYGAAAEKGDADAQFHLGEMYLYAHGVEKDPVRAVEWYTKAAALNHARAQGMLGTIHENGWGIERNPARALLWYGRAANNRDPWGMAGLGEMIQRGDGTDADPVAAMTWFLLAIRHGGRFYHDFRDNLAPELTPEQMAEARRRAKAWKPEKVEDEKTGN